MQELRQLVDMYYQIQKFRISVGNRLSALDREADEARSIDRGRWEQWFTRVKAIEGEIAQEFEGELELHSAWPWLTQVKGVGPVLGGKLLGLIGDIGVSPTVSSLWRFAGQDPTASRLVKGEKAVFNKRLKTVCFLVGRQMLMVNSPYRRIYDEAKADYEQNRPDWKPLRRHYAAIRKMVKIFLSHLWVKWREAEGLPVSEPYILAQPGHSRYYGPDEFVKPTGV